MIIYLIICWSSFVFWSSVLIWVPFVFVLVWRTLQFYWFETLHLSYIYPLQPEIALIASNLLRLCASWAVQGVSVFWVLYLSFSHELRLSYFPSELKELNMVLFFVPIILLKELKELIICASVICLLRHCSFGEY